MEKRAYTVGGNVIDAATVDTVWNFLKKLKIGLPSDPGRTPREKRDLKGRVHPSVHGSTVNNGQDTGATNMSINR